MVQNRLTMRAVGLADAAGPLAPPGGVHREHVRLGRDADQAVEREHGDGEGVDAADLVVESKKSAGRPARMSGEAADGAQARRESA